MMEFCSSITCHNGLVTAITFSPVSAGGAVTSVSNVDGSLTISPTTGDVVASINASNANVWVGTQTFNGGIDLPINVDIVAGQTTVIVSNEGNAGFPCLDINLPNSVGFRFSDEASGNAWLHLYAKDSSHFAEIDCAIGSRLNLNVGGQQVWLVASSFVDAIGVPIFCSANDSLGSIEDQFDITPSWIDSTHATRKARAIFHITDTGYREALRLDANGTSAQVGVGGAVNGSNLLTVNGNLDVLISTATTNAVVNSSFFEMASSGTTANGFGELVQYNLQSDNGTMRTATDFTVSWVAAADASRKARALLHVYDTTAREVMRGEASGSAPLLSFYGNNAVAQYATTGTTTGFTAGAGTTVDSAATFTGNTGATAYTIGDIVRALKLVGIMTS